MQEKTEITSIFPIFSLYLLPISAWIASTYLTVLPSKSWLITLIGLAILFLGTTLFFVFVRGIKAPKETSKSLPLAAPPVDYSPQLNQKIEELQKELEGKDSLIKEREESFEKALKEASQAKDSLQSQILELTSKEEIARQRIEELEIQSHQKQQGIQQLENQIHDLRYEIKTLLHLTEVDYGQIGIDIPTKEQLHLDQKILEEPFLGPISTENEAEKLLKRCIQIAENITPGYKASNLRSLSKDPYAFDLRRLSDSLRLESGALILLYSPKENKIQFANKEAKTLLGWSSDRFSQDFQEILGQEFSLFENKVEELSNHARTTLVLPFTAKNKWIVRLHGVLGTIPSGIFRSLILGVFYSPLA